MDWDYILTMRACTQNYWNLQTLADVTQFGNSAEMHQFHRRLVSNDGCLKIKKFVSYLGVVLLPVFKKQLDLFSKGAILKIFGFVRAHAHARFPNNCKCRNMAETPKDTRNNISPDFTSSRIILNIKVVFMYSIAE